MPGDVARGQGVRAAPRQRQRIGVSEGPGLLFFSLYTWDFYSDVMFNLRLGDAGEWLLCGLALLFIALPWTLNLAQLFRAQKQWTTGRSVQEGVRSWLIDWSIVLVIAVCVSGNSFGAIELANSNLFVLSSNSVCLVIDPTAFVLSSNSFGADIFYTTMSASRPRRSGRPSGVS